MNTLDIGSQHSGEHDRPFDPEYHQPHHPLTLRSAKRVTKGEATCPTITSTHSLGRHHLPTAVIPARAPGPRCGCAQLRFVRDERSPDVRSKDHDDASTAERLLGPGIRRDDGRGWRSDTVRIPN